MGMIRIYLVYYGDSKPVNIGKLQQQIKAYTTRYTQRKKNTLLDVTSLASVIKYCKEDNKLKPNM